MANRWRLNRGSFASITLTCVLALASESMVAVAASPSGLSQDQFDHVRTIVWADSQNFGGFSVSETGHTLTLYRVRASNASPAQGAILSDVDRTASTDDGTPKVWSVEVVNVDHSLAELSAVQDEIQTTQPWAAHAEPYLAQWYVDPSINAVRVKVTSISPQLVADASVFGNRVRLGIGQRQTPVSKTWDGPPWWGGDSITGLGTDGKWHGCTGGFPAINRSNGHPGMLTAGHCFASNATIYQYGSVMGTVTWRVFGTPYDAEFIDASAHGGVGPYVYTSETGTAGMRGLKSPQPGDQVCADGYVTGQNCNARIDWINGCTVWGNGTVLCRMDDAVSTNGSVLDVAGDSGGPVYYYGGGGLIADGIISGTGDGKEVGFTPIIDFYLQFQLYCLSGC